MAVVDELAQFGAHWGTAETFELGRIANAVPADPEDPRRHRREDRRDRVPSGLSRAHAPQRRRRPVVFGVGCRRRGGEVRAVARAARLYMTAQVEAGHIMPMSMTNAAVAALAQRRRSPTAGCRSSAAANTIPPPRPVDREGRRHGRHGDDRKAGRQRSQRQQHPGGRGRRPHVAADRAQMVPLGAGQRRLSGACPGDSRGCRASSCRASCPTAAATALRLMRLKDKLGNRSNATAEAEFDGAAGWLIGEPGQGLADASSTW